jgi:hypothetical protein
MQVSVFIFFLKMNGRGRTKMLMHINTTSVLADVNKYDIFFISLTDANKFPPVVAESLDTAEDGSAPLILGLNLLTHSPILFF